VYHLPKHCVRVISTSPDVKVRNPKYKALVQNRLELPQDVLRLVRIGKRDAQDRSDDFLSLRRLVMCNEESYPHISRWFDSRVSYGLRTGERLGFVALLNELPVATAIVKRGETAKFCHLKIDQSVRSRSLGDLLFSLMTLDVRNRAKRVKFTLPESVWADRKTFFNAFSFAKAERAKRQYRLFDTELYSETAFADLLTASKEKLPRLFGQLAIGDHSLITGAVLAIQPGPLEKIFAGTKKVEIRARFSQRWEQRKVSLYATHPVSGLAGEATISRVIEGSPDRIWEHFGNLAGCTRAEYEAYVKERASVQALLLSDVRRFQDPVPLTQLRYLLGIDLPAPQSYLSLENSDGWLTAVVLAAALQGSIKVSAPKRHSAEELGPASIAQFA
jgi:predicted transcriptional regulator